MAGLCPPLPTLRRRPYGRQRTARGRCGSLLLPRSGLAPPTPCRSPGALRVLHAQPRSRVSVARLSRSRALRAAPFALTGAHVGQSGLTDPGERNANKSRVSPVRCASPVARYLSRHRDVMTCLALSFADDHLENGRGLLTGLAKAPQTL